MAARAYCRFTCACSKCGMFIMLLLGSLPTACSNSDGGKVAIVSVWSPRDLQRSAPGIVANFSSPLAAVSRNSEQSFDFQQEVETWVPEDEYGCSPFSKPAYLQHAVAVLRRGNCTFVQKAFNSQVAGAVGLLVVWDSEPLRMMVDNTSAEIHILVLSITKKFGDPILTRNQVRTIYADVKLSIAAYVAPTWDWADVVISMLATTLVGVGAWIASADLRSSSPLAPSESDVIEISRELTLLFVVVGSILLMTLYFFMTYMVYFVIACFCVGGICCMTIFGSVCLLYVFPILKQPLPLLSFLSHGDILAALLASVVVACWFLHRNTEQGWIYQNFIGTFVLCMMQRTLRLPNIRIATLLLVVMFFYDIFWVFISPLLFRTSVMVEVANGGSATASKRETMPMLLRIPAISDPIGSERMLGFGDIVLPGLFVSFVLRYDTLRKKSLAKGIFGPALSGYAIAIVATTIVVHFTNIPQPALLYLVPATLGPTFFLSWIRGECRELWRTEPEKLHQS